MFTLTGLPLFWNGCQQHGLDLSYVTRCLCEAPAKLAGLHTRKGQIAVGMDADFVVWNPEDYTTVGMINICTEIMQLQIQIPTALNAAKPI